MFLLLLIVGFSFSAGPRCESVDLIELNHVYGSKGELIFDQVIFCERMPETGEFRVKSWCLVEDSYTLNRRPVRNYETGTYQVYWHDSDQRIYRKISSKLYHETWTKKDREKSDFEKHRGMQRFPVSERTVKRDE